MTNALTRQTIVAEIERAKVAWDAANPGTPLLIDYENKGTLDLSSTALYLVVDVIFRDADQLDLGPVGHVMIRDDGQIQIAAGVKEGTGTQAAEKLRDFMRPYLQLRDNLANGVRTHAGKPYPPSTANGFYYLPLIAGFWVDAVAPTTP